MSIEALPRECLETSVPRAVSIGSFCQVDEEGPIVVLYIIGGQPIAARFIGSYLLGEGGIRDDVHTVVNTQRQTEDAKEHPRLVGPALDPQHPYISYPLEGGGTAFKINPWLPGKGLRAYSVYATLNNPNSLEASATV